MTYSIEFTIPLLPHTTNSLGRAHWSKKVREARTWHQLVRLAVRGQLPHEPLKRSELTLTRHSSRRPDHDGLVSSFKHVIDGLVKANVIAGDAHEYIGIPTYDWGKVGPKKAFITVKVESVA